METDRFSRSCRFHLLTMKTSEPTPVRRTVLHYVVNIVIVAIFLIIIFNFLPRVG